MQIFIQWHETERFILVQVTRRQQVCSFLFTTNLPLKFCHLHKNLQIKVKKIRRPLWQCVNRFKKWPHVPQVRCSLKPIRLQRDQKQRCYLRKKPRRKCNINKERYHVSIQSAHICSVRFFFIQIVFYGSMLQNKAYCLLLSDVSSLVESFAIPMSFSMGFHATPLALEMV